LAQLNIILAKLNIILGAMQPCRSPQATIITLTLNKFIESANKNAALI